MENGECKCRSRSKSKIFKIATPTYVYFDKTVHITSLQINCLKICKQFDFTCAILLNGGCEGHIKVRCKKFDEFEIAIQVDTKIKTLCAIFDKI